MADVESTRATAFTGSKWSYTRTASARRPQPIGAMRTAQPSRTARIGRPAGCHAAQASSTQPATQPRSVAPPATYEPAAVWNRYRQSLTEKTSRPAAMNPQARPIRHPEIASTQTTNAIVVRSASG